MEQTYMLRKAALGQSNGALALLATLGNAW